MAQTSGSARGLERRRRRLISTPRPTPRTPVRQVMSPKMRLEVAVRTGTGSGGLDPWPVRLLPLLNPTPFAQLPSQPQFV